jgi:acyl-CoA thioesterase-1
MSMRMRPFWLLLVTLLFTASMPVQAAAPTTVLVFGDSLSAAYGLPREAGWVHLLAERGERHRLRFRVVNASVSGETTAGGLARLPALLQAHRPDLVIIALGANDGLRGLPLAQMRDNLTRMIELARRAGSDVLLVGMHLPPNYGPAYTRKFHDSFHDIARAQKVGLVPFLLDGMATRRELFQVDGLHPTAAAQPIILENVWRQLEPRLQSTRHGTGRHSKGQEGVAATMRQTDQSG